MRLALLYLGSSNILTIGPGGVDISISVEVGHRIRGSQLNSQFIIVLPVRGNDMMNIGFFIGTCNIYL